MDNESREIQREIKIGQIQDQFNKVRAKVAESASRFERRNRVTTTTIMLMLLTAICYDLLEIGVDLIPIIGWIISFFVGTFSWLTFYVWTSIKGWGMSDSFKKFVVSKILPFIGLIPVVNAIPEITLSVILTILIVKSEDFVYNKTQGKIDENVIKEGLNFFNIFRDV